MIREIPPHLAETFWPLVEGLLVKALRFHPHLTADGLRNLLIHGKAELVIGLEGSSIVVAAAMETRKYPTKMVGNVLVVGGEVGTLKTHGESMEKALEQWCKTRNLGTLHMLGRAGWSRFVTRHGWRTQRAVTAWKELT